MPLPHHLLRRSILLTRPSFARAFCSVPTPPPRVPGVEIRRDPKKELTFADDIEHATGEEKVMKLLEERGITDPYYLEPITRGPGTKDNPVIVPSFESKRLVGCLCEEDATGICYMWVHKGDPRRCECGYWIKCVDAVNHFEQIQKELDAGLLP